MNQIELDGKVAIVTGAAQGIGRAIAERLLNSGAQVWLWDRDEHVLAETAAQLGENARSLCVDVSAFQNVICCRADRGRRRRADRYHGQQRRYFRGQHDGC